MSRLDPDVRAVLQTLVDMYVRNQGTSHEFIACITPPTASECERNNNRDQNRCWLAWDAARALLEPARVGSYPFLNIATDYDVPYHIVLRISDMIENMARIRPTTAAKLKSADGFLHDALKLANEYAGDGGELMYREIWDKLIYWGRI